MLRIGKLTDYAMLIISQMAKDSQSILSATSLAETLHLSAPTVSKILKILSDRGLVKSVRGAEGGYHLAKDAAQITVADIISAMEGGISVAQCCENFNVCDLTGRCVLRENLLKINKLVHSVLDGFTIVDMLSPLVLHRLPHGK